jgi:DedD protein
MRDSHRMKEKYDLSLDSRQVVSLLVAGIVVLGAVFVLGVLVGKKLAGSQRNDRAPDLLSALDQKSAALERARAAPALTFQEELTADAGATRSTPPKTSPEKKPEAAPKAAEAKADTPKTPGDKKPEAAAKPADAGPIAARTAPAAAPAAVAPTSKASDGAAPTGAFTLQLGASQNRDDAERMVSRLREKGYAPYIVTADVPGKGTFYRVRMGSFPTREAAGRYLEDFKRETKTEAFVAATK